MSLPARLVCHNLWFRYGERYALAGAELEAAQGEPVALVGPNGGGKTTLLRILAGRLTPTEGEVRWEDATGRPVPAGALASARVFVSAEPGLCWDWSARANLELFARLQGLPPRRAARALSVLGLDPEDPRPASDLSHGQRRRADLARLLLGEPRVVLLDEPELGLDRWARAKLLEILEALTPKSLLLLATHDLALAQDLGCRLVLVATGRVRRDPPDAAGPVSERADIPMKEVR